MYAYKLSEKTYIDAQVPKIFTHLGPNIKNIIKRATAIEVNVIPPLNQYFLSFITILYNKKNRLRAVILFITISQQMVANP